MKIDSHFALLLYDRILILYEIINISYKLTMVDLEDVREWLKID